MIKNVWLIGTGYMAHEYVKVLVALGVEIIVIGRNKKNCLDFQKKTGIKVFNGGLSNFLKTNPEIPKAVINAVGIESLTYTTESLLNFGVKYILLEKPGFGNPSELFKTVKLVKDNKADVFLAYNRRFYSSVIKAKEIIKREGGVKSFTFEFTEWSHTIKELKKEKVELENWFYGNSSHLIDLAFYLGGSPKELTAFKKGDLVWHPSGEIFSGSGITNTGALFSYIANWSSPGRWNLEICTKNSRLLFKPVEKLQIIKIGSINIEDVENINYEYDNKYKPGVYLQTKLFLEQNTVHFPKIDEQLSNYNNFYKKINF